MCGILIIGVSYCIYWIFTYDDRNPNPVTTSEHESNILELELEPISEPSRVDSTDERLEIRTGSYAH